MKIGFDAKRAFRNATGLGSYSRTLIDVLSEQYPEHEYHLYTPSSATGKYINWQPPSNNTIHIPEGLYKFFSGFWRSFKLSSQIKNNHIDLYHGLTHELPYKIRRSGVKSVVTIHDLIFLRYPEQYALPDKGIYKEKFSYACSNADHIIAISEQTKEDIIHYFKIPEEKISVIYQSYHPVFDKVADKKRENELLKKYKLPEEYLLYTGSIIERKNLLTLIKAIHHSDNADSLPLVVVGDGKTYKKKVTDYIKKYALQGKIFFLNEVPLQDLQALYRQAKIFIYPSFFEGFGIPVIEAMACETPVITSRSSCLPETGGDAAFYINPENPEDIASAINTIISDESLREQMTRKGQEHIKKFDKRRMAENIMNLYFRLVK